MCDKFEYSEKNMKLFLLSCFLRYNYHSSVLTPFLFFTNTNNDFIFSKIM